MFTSIRTSEKNKTIVSELTKKFNLGPENNIARIAYCYSISSNEKLNLNDSKDSKGKEYSRNVLFGKYDFVYIALICQHYKIHKSDPCLSKYVKIHIDDGLERIHTFFQKSPNSTPMDFLINLAQDKT